ncbi:MAG: hypothetical protein ACI4P6_03470 [Candidatus Spyradosoma sp.]
MKTDMDIRKQPIRPADWERIFIETPFNYDGLAEFAAAMAFEIQRVAAHLPFNSSYEPGFVRGDFPSFRRAPKPLQGKFREARRKRLPDLAFQPVRKRKRPFPRAGFFLLSRRRRRSFFRREKISFEVFNKCLLLFCC